MTELGFALFEGESKPDEAINLHIANAIARVEGLNNEALRRIDRAFELLKLEEAGRLVVLPCKAGQSLYALGNQYGVWQIKECEAEEFVIDKRRDEVSVHFECDNDCEGCPFNSWAQEHSGEWSCDGEYGQAMIGFEAFGAWVFLTREEAEKALEGMK